jgi:hypothetical protein
VKSKEFICNRKMQGDDVAYISRPTKNKPLFTFLVELIIAVWTNSILGWAIADDVFDPRFFTYFTYAFGAYFYSFMGISEVEPYLNEFLIVFLLPIYMGLAVFVYVAIVVIVYNNDWVIIRDSVFGGADLTMGEVHTGDWFFHYFPPFTLLVYCLVNYAPVTTTNFVLWSNDNKLAKIAYCCYVIVIPPVILGYYMLTMPFDENYPMKMRTWQICFMVFLLSTFIQVTYLFGSYSAGMNIGKHLVKHRENFRDNKV